MFPKCEKCNCETIITLRVNEYGVKGIRWCIECMVKYQPELFRNELEDSNNFAIEKIIVGKKVWNKLIAPLYK